MTLSQEFERHDGLGLAALVRRREVTPAELLEATLSRIEAWNPSLNAVVHVMADAARRDIDAGLPEGPFTGVPFLVKDLYSFCAGAPCRNGSRLFHHYRPTSEPELVRRYRAAGLVLAGRTATSELGLSVSTEPHAGGPTRNPWDTQRSVGGSSGGSAAAVACGMVPMAHGSDGGGSIRIPASCCGLFGLKPSRGRITFGPDVGEAWAGLATVHALTRSVRDSAALLDATAGPLTGDPYLAPPPARPFLREVGADAGRLRIGFSTAAPDGSPVDQDCLRAVNAAAALATDLGHVVEPASPEVDAAAIRNVMVDVVAAHVAQTLATGHPTLHRRVRPEDVEPLTWAFAERGRRFSATHYLATVRDLHALGRRFAQFFERHDVWLSPTLATPPPRLGAFDTSGDDPHAFSEAVARFTPFTQIANISGHPAASIPLCHTSNGMPVGVQATGGYGEEATLLRLAAQFEQARPWIGRRPGPPPSGSGGG